MYDEENMFWDVRDVRGSGRTHTYARENVG